MKTVRDSQTKREKELRILTAKEDKEISFETTERSYIEERFNDLDSKLTRLESTLLKILEANAK